MECGHVAAGGNQIFWTKRDSYLVGGILRPEEELLERPSAFCGAMHNVSYLCRSCRRVLTEY